MTDPKTNSNLGDLGPTEVNTHPHPRTHPASDVRFLGFLPHSGFHNQRMALENALLLGKLLNRTVCVIPCPPVPCADPDPVSKSLLPPVWTGWPAGASSYDDLVGSISILIPS